MSNDLSDVAGLDGSLWASTPQATVLFFLSLYLVLAESCPALPFPEDPDVVFPEYYDTGDRAIDGGGSVLLGESG